MQYVPILVFALIYAAAAAAWDMSPLVAAAYACASVFSFIAYALDKSAARAGRRRIPEHTLLLLGFACGWPGALLAQQWLRHKSSKASFRWRFWASAVLNVGAFVYLGSVMS